MTISAPTVPLQGTTRRRLVAGTAVLSALPILAACGGGTNESADANKPEAARGRIVHWSNQMFPFHEDIGAEFVKEFRAKYPNIEYVAETVLGDRFEKLVTAAAADSAPDIGMSTPFQVQELGLKGIARAHDDYLKKSRVVKQSDLWPTLTYDLIYKGKQYGMPFAPDVRVMYLNTSVLRGAGLDPNKPAQSWDELEDHVKRIYRGGEASPLGFPPYWGSGGSALWLVPFWQLGGETINKEGDKITIDNEHGIKALEWLKKMYELQGGWDAVAARQKQATTSNTHFISGNMGYYFATFTERKSKEFLAQPDFKFMFSPWPTPKGGRRTNYGGNHTFLLTQQSKTPEVAWKFMEFLAQEDIVLRFATRYDRIPVRMDVAKGQAYQQNDPFLKLAVEEMGYRRFHIPAPGGGEIQALHNKLGAEAASGQRPVREVLKDYTTQMQQILDKFKS
ncbi:MAG TPA: extracellular solute-binding protein [Chloroflexota bacterium]|nr:extracellular solute-binding protein [Chloroflexota bacterium]